MEKKFSMVITAQHLFDGVNSSEYEGYLCLKDNRIVQKEKGKTSKEILEQSDHVLQFTEELVMPGITDTHTFFTGYAVFHVGADLSEVRDNKKGLEILEAYEKRHNPKEVLLGHGWQPEKWNRQDGEQMLEENYSDRPVILFAADRSTCMMNLAAKKKYQFTPETCYPESYYRVMSAYLNDREFIDQEFSDYMTLMNSRGVTTVKEMGFDDFYGFTEYLKEMEENDRLRMRIHFMSQPVGAPMNLPYARKMRDQFTGDKVRFSGFNRMTDGTIASGKGELKEAYAGKDYICTENIPWEEIEADVLKADEEGFRWSLHAQGDGAVGKIADIYEKCQKSGGKLKNRHAITDMEFTSPDDLERLGKLGGSAELYFQIMSLDPADVLIENINRTIGKERGKYYWNRRKMQDSGMNLSGATDLPLMITSVPQSIYYSCGGYMDGREETFQKENTITVSEMLKAWTAGGQRNLGQENILGTLEEGKLADITVFDRNLLTADIKKIREAKVIMTIMDGQIVYKK